MTELQNIDEMIANQYFYILYRKIFDIDRTVLTLNVLTLFFFVRLLNKMAKEPRI